MNLKHLPKGPGVYVLVNSASPSANNEWPWKSYVGSAVDVYHRCNKGHLKVLQKNQHNNTYLQNAWNKHGEESFSFILLEECEAVKEVLIAREQWWLDRKHLWR